MRGSNDVAIGYDEGSVMIKVQCDDDIIGKNSQQKSPAILYKSHDLLP